MKITILFYSETGNTEKMAGFVRDGILGADGGIEVSLMNLAKEDNIDTGFLNTSSAIIFGTPCYTANTCWQMKKFFDERSDCLLEGKLAACFATADCAWGGADLAILTILQHALTRGMLAYSTGMEFGNPYIHLGPVAVIDDSENITELFSVFGNRVARKALQLFNK